jgi:hypothetical protein
MYSATRYFAPQYFAERYFAGQETAPVVSYAYFAQKYFAKRYFANRYFSGQVTLDPFDKPLFSSLLALSNVSVAKLIVNRPLASLLAAQSVVATASSTNLIFLVSSLIAASSVVGSLVVLRPLVSLLNASSLTSVANLSLLPSTISNLAASSAVSAPKLHISRVLTSSLVARSSTESWNQLISVSWTDPTPAYTAHYELEYRINLAPSFIISGLTLTSHTWSVRVNIGDTIYVRTRTVSIDMPPIYSDWSEWSDGWIVPETPHRAELILVGGLYSNLAVVSAVSNARLGRLQAKVSNLTVTSVVSSPNLKLITIRISSNLVVTSVVSSAKLNILQSKTSALVVESTVLNALLVISQAKTSNLTAISSVSQASLLVASGYPQTSIITAGSTVSSATLKVIRSFASALLAESVTTTSSLVIERKLATVLSISSAVPSADLIINRALSSLLTAGSIVSLADLIATRMFISALVANSSVSSINLAVYRPFASLLIATSSISMPILAIGNQRPLSSVLAAESSTLPKPHLVIKRELISNNIALSATFGNLRNLRALVSELIAYSIVANADLSVTKLLGIISILTATSSVGGLRRLTVQRPLSTSLSVSSSLVGALQIDRALQSLLTGVSVITAIRPSTVTIAGLLSVEFGEVGTYNSPYLDQDMIKLLNQPTLEVGDVT